MSEDDETRRLLRDIHEHLGALLLQREALRGEVRQAVAEAISEAGERLRNEAWACMTDVEKELFRGRGKAAWPGADSAAVMLAAGSALRGPVPRRGGKDDDDTARIRLMRNGTVEARLSRAGRRKLWAVVKVAAVAVSSWLAHSAWPYLQGLLSRSNQQQLPPH